MFLNREGKNSVYTSFEQHRGFNACMYVGTGDNVYKIRYAIGAEGFASVTVYPEKQMVIPKGREYEAAFVLNKFSRTMKSGHFFIGGIEGYNYSLHIPYIDSPISEESFERMEMIGIMMASETIEEMKLLCTGMPKQTDDTSGSYKSFVQDMIKRSKRRKKKKEDENEPKGFMDLIIGDNPDYSTDAEDVSGFDEDEILITDDENEIPMGEFAKNLEKEGKECKGNNDDGEE